MKNKIKKFKVNAYNFDNEYRQYIQFSSFADLDGACKESENDRDFFISCKGKIELVSSYILQKKLAREGIDLTAFEDKKPKVETNGK